MIDDEDLARARAGYRRFIEATRQGATDFALTPRAEATSYARCFALFGLHLLRQLAASDIDPDAMVRDIRRDLETLRAGRLASGATLQFDKPYLQLLTFSLSALAILGRLRSDPLPDHVMPLLSRDIRADLDRAGALRGVARSGNTAMFMAILLLHARDYLGRDTSAEIAEWRDAHLETINRFGFWGRTSTMSHLQFQNGYHQYEVLEYLGAHHPGWELAARAVSSLADAEGHYAPYPGGGGCYDYDAVFVLTGAGDSVIAARRELLLRTATTILAEQNADGGFAESLRVRPRSLANLGRVAAHIAAGRGAARIERLRHGLTLQRPKHNRVHTHWSRYSRGWGESDLWDSWFRMLAVARIQVALQPARASAWGFINYPGIGFHPAAREDTAR